ncbi:protoporphyrinogen oxidase [Paenibacillus hodogayensis]|uniref:Coproporphyrinogen III oxidase n=1 Tax=Paenibacillus hodogayensis TaxID=279208 RepID=A0ABV5VWD4_9BACL
MGERTRKRVVIAGGGISGLTAAFYVRNALERRHIEADISIVEKSDLFGGKIRTLHRDGFVIEQGPDSFLARKLSMIELTRDLGLEGELTGTNPKANKTYIVHKGKLQRMPKGLVLGVPTEMKPFLGSELVSPAGKARAAMDFMLPRRKETGDESVGDFFERRLGKEVLHHIAEPILAGIYAGDARKLSLEATFPQFQQAEQKYGSLMKGMTASRLNTPPPSPVTEAIPFMHRKSVFLTYRRGLVTILEGLRNALEDTIDIQAAVQELVRDNDQYVIGLDQGERLEADAVILAMPAFAIAPLLGQMPEAQWLGKMDYVSVANVVLAYDKEAMTHPLDGSGFVIPRTEGRFITACTWTSSKWLHTAPEGKALIRCYVGRAGDQGWKELSDEEIVRRVRQDVAELMGIEAEPLFVEIARLNHSMPQYEVGHVERIRQLREALQTTMPGVYVTGPAFEGVGIPDSVRQAKAAAEAAATYLAGGF